MDWQNSYLNFKNKSALDSIKAAEKRQESFDLFSKYGLPTKNDEAWKFTSLANFKSKEWGLHTDDEAHLTHEQMQEISKNLPSEFINFVFVNGVLNNTLSDDADNLMEITELTEADFKFNDKDIENRITHLAQAFLSKKINLNVTAHKTIDKPVQIVFVQSSKNSVYLSEKLNITMQENSEMKLIVQSMSFINSTADALNINISINVEKSARLDFIQLQNEDTESFHFSQCKIELAENCNFKSLVLSLGNKLTRNYFHLNFKANNAGAEVYGLSIIDKEQHADNYTFIEHAMPENNSVQKYKSILSGSSHSVFRGRVLIAQDAQKAHSEQLNNNLLLTRTAQAESIPQLEIFADDVKASHGSTVGQLNKEEIFYFLSRGINQYQAVKMMSYGFAKELIYKIENENIQNHLILALNKKLENMVPNA